MDRLNRLSSVTQVPTTTGRSPLRKVSQSDSAFATLLTEKTLRALYAKGTPLEHALPCMTSNVAAHLRLARKGQLVAGHDADLCVLDPSLHLRHVMARGRFHVRDGKPTSSGTFERVTP